LIFQLQTKPLKQTSDNDIEQVPYKTATASEVSAVRGMQGIHFPDAIFGEEGPKNMIVLSVGVQKRSPPRLMN
jgi:hypothetical protein